MSQWAVETNSLGCVWIEDGTGQTVCDLYHRTGNHAGQRADTAADFYTKPNARRHARQIVEAINASTARPQITPTDLSTERASDGRPDDPHNGQCPVDEVAQKYRGAA